MDHLNASEYETNDLNLGTCIFLMVAFCNIFFFSFQYKNCPVFVLWAMLRKYVIGNKSPILRGLLPRLIVPNGNKWNSCPLLMICCQPISWMVIANSKEHCQRHNGPEGWVHLAKITSLGHITSSYSNLDQISSSESRSSINLKISTKYQHLD